LAGHEARHDQQQQHRLHAGRAARAGRARLRRRLREKDRRRLSHHRDARARRVHRRAGHGLSRHRVGPKGFIKVIDEHTLGFADYRGNRQYITLGNLSENDRAYLFLIDFSRRQRIKLWGRARVVENDDALIETLFDHGYKARPERVILFTIEAWDVNCSQHITARLSETEIEQMMEVVQERVAALQAENASLRALLAERRPDL
jgi:hypothetical protein